MSYLLLAIILFCLTAFSALSNGRIDLSKSLSLHICRSRRSIMIARIGFTAITVLMFIWFYGEFSPTHQPPVDASVGMGIFGITIFAQGMFPYNQRSAWNRIHDISAWIAAFTGPTLLLRFASISNGTLQELLLIGGIISFIPLIAFGIAPRVKRYFLPLQLSMVVISFIAFLALSVG